MKTTTVAIVTIALTAGINLSVQAQEVVPSAAMASESVAVGDFSISVPTEWRKFTAQEAAIFERQYQQQSREIYRNFAGSDDPTKSVRVAAYHTSGKNGSFVIVVMSLPPQANLMPMLQKQIEPKMQYGIQQGFIKKYLGMVSVDSAPITGFYTKAVGRSGNVQVSGGVEHSRKKHTIVQLTLLAPVEWNEDAAVAALEKVLASLKLKAE
jgi:hypothetical protein